MLILTAITNSLLSGTALGGSLAAFLKTENQKLQHYVLVSLIVLSALFSSLLLTLFALPDLRSLAVTDNHSLLQMKQSGIFLSSLTAFFTSPAGALQTVLLAFLLRSVFLHEKNYQIIFSGALLLGLSGWLSPMHMAEFTTGTERNGGALPGQNLSYLFLIHQILALVSLGVMAACGAGKAVRCRLALILSAISFLFLYINNELTWADRFAFSPQENALFSVLIASAFFSYSKEESFLRISFPAFFILVAYSMLLNPHGLSNMQPRYFEWIMAGAFLAINGWLVYHYIIAGNVKPFQQSLLSVSTQIAILFFAGTAALQTGIRFNGIHTAPGTLAELRYLVPFAMAAILIAANRQFLEKKISLPLEIGVPAATLLLVGLAFVALSASPLYILFAMAGSAAMAHAIIRFSPSYKAMILLLLPVLLLTIPENEKRNTMQLAGLEAEENMGYLFHISKSESKAIPDEETAFLYKSSWIADVYQNDEWKHGLNLSSSLFPYYTQTSGAYEGVTSRSGSAWFYALPYKITVYPQTQEDSRRIPYLVVREFLLSSLEMNLLLLLVVAGLLVFWLTARRKAEQ